MRMTSNFEFLSDYWEDLAELGKTAESYLYSDPPSCIFKIGLMGEHIVSEIFSIEKLTLPETSTQADRIKILRRTSLIPKTIDDLLFAIRKARNDAVHNGNSSVEKAETLLRMAHNLSIWFMQVYGDWEYKPDAYEIPEDRSEEEDFAEYLNTQEEKLKELLETIQQIKSVVPALPHEERIEKSELASDNITLSDSEADYLAGEQIRLDISYVPVVNYALQQNKFPILQAISIINNSETPLEDLELEITTSPVFSLPAKKLISRVPEKSVVELRDLSLTLDGEFLVTLTEKIEGLIQFTLRCGEEVLYSENAEITLLAFDEWHGYTIYPELLSSFVTPNHPDLIKIKSRVAEILEEWTSDPSLDAYQRENPKRVRDQAAAVYRALQEQNIIYSTHPASFGDIGQRVRLCDAVLNQKFGTCLDLTLLYAGCLEALGLNPLLIILPGHSFVGLWLDNKSFPDSVIDDSASLTKRLSAGIKDMLVVETTALVAGKKITFEEACAAAERELVGLNSLECLIDVRRARLNKIIPLPIRIQTPSGWEVTRPELELTDISSAPSGEIQRIQLEEDEPKKDAASRIDLWERKLLDLGLRNTLISMRLTKKVLPLFTHSLEELNEVLDSGKTFTIYPIPTEWPTPRTHLNPENIHDLGDMQSLISEDFKLKRLRTIYTEEDTESRLKSLYREAKVSIEENGANTLYLAFGILRWYENTKTEKPRYAPIVLIPVELERKFGYQYYTLRIRDEDPQLNITLLEKLKQDFHIVVNGLETLPLTENGVVDLRRIYTILRHSVMNQKRWDVLESAYLGIFSFSQFVMWNDVHNRTEELANNKIVKSLIEGSRSWDGEQMDPDAPVSENSVYLPIPADASQLYAIESACNGKSFVLHGPPGTGKSQTITSLIANSLAQGKTVLFVAEKMAALEVVQKRLDNLGLSPFCLELHSNKAKKKDILEQLQTATEVTKKISPREFQEKAVQIGELRKELNLYASSLHRPLRCGRTLFELVNTYEEYSKYPDVCKFSPYFVKNLTSRDITIMDEIVSRLRSAAALIYSPSNHPLQAIKGSDYSQQLRYSLSDALPKYQTAVSAFAEILEEFEMVTDYQTASTFDDLCEREETVKQDLEKYEPYLSCIDLQQICGKSIRTLFNEYESYIKFQSMFSLSPGNTDGKTDSELGKQEEFVHQILSAGQKIRSPAVHPLVFVTTKNKSADIDVRTSDLVREYRLILSQVQETARSLTERTGLPKPHQFADYEKLSSLSENLYSLHGLPYAWGSVKNPEAYFNGVIKLTSLQNEMLEKAQEIRKTWEDDFLNMDGNGLKREFVETSEKWFLGKALGLKNLLKRLRPYMKSPVTKEELGDHLAALALYQSVRAEAEEYLAKYRDDLEHLYSDAETDWNKIAENAVQAKEAYRNLSTSGFLYDIQKHVENSHSLDSITGTFVDEWKLAARKKQEISSLLEISSTTAEDWISGQLTLCDTLDQNINQLKPWIEWNWYVAEANAKNLSVIPSAYSQGESTESIMKSYKKEVLYHLLYSAFDDEFSLPQISFADHYEIVENICDIEMKLEYNGRAPDIPSLFRTYIDRWETLSAAKDTLYNLLTIEMPDEDNWVAEQEKLCIRITENADNLKEWMTWNSVAEEAEAEGLETVVEALYSGVSLDVIQGGFRKALFKALSSSAIDEDEILNHFSGAQFNEKISLFREIDERFSELTRQEIYARLASRLPDFNREVAQRSSMARLKKAIKSKGRGISVRKLFEEMPDLISRLCPCMLMSPISAAQYLDPGREPFDLIVFDEASQLPTWKAVGALARGREAVIVGDPKQMPPTSFFMKNTDDEDNEEEDLESILDDCSVLGMPETELLWHYRSRHESLIAFSNNKFYENQLYTFPSVDERESRVRLVHVDGVYERKSDSRVNRAEAQAVVQEIKRRYKDPKLSKQSIGVVTFNIKQQGLIDDLLALECSSDAKFADWVYSSEEPIFIKNLENVQGDERDVILFSIGYGPDEEGKVSMNFGPLNREGGWRRLNVAISRSRYEMVVFSTLEPEQINLSRTKAKGVLHLKEFLEYAKGMPLPVEEGAFEIQSKQNDGIAQSLAGILKEHGYDTDLHVGHSKYRVDVGVVDPDNPERYLLGILLDGESYGLAKTTRDRELAQVNVLNGLGWRTTRLWSMDWWDNREKEIRRILDLVEGIRKNPSAYPVEEKKTKKQTLVYNTNTSSSSKAYTPELIAKEDAVNPRIQKKEYEKTESMFLGFGIYDFIGNKTREMKTLARAKEIIELEGPISLNLLNHRLADSLSVERLTALYQDELEYFYRKVNLKGYGEGEQQVFFWPEGQTPEIYMAFRTPGVERRNADDISIYEAANALCYALESNVSLPTDDLTREGAKLLGFSRRGPSVQKLMDSALKLAEKMDRIKMKNGVWKLST